MYGSGQEHHKTLFFSSKSHIPGSVRSYITRYCEGPGEQPSMTLVLPLLMNVHCIIKWYTCF